MLTSLIEQRSLFAKFILISPDLPFGTDSKPQFRTAKSLKIRKKTYRSSPRSDHDGTRLHVFSICFMWRHFLSDQLITKKEEFRIQTKLKPTHQALIKE
ncbi:MAG: hypothetical protein NVV73_03900 [Cellvibrionaceae bacterium]|nr:hypothetical protein [Cellvibrionaceae bacterium]